jgi:hypothetical protein
MVTGLNCESRAEPASEEGPQVHAALRFLVVRLAGLEPATFGSVDRCSIQLSYRRVPANSLMPLPFPQYRQGARGCQPTAVGVLPGRRRGAAVSRFQRTDGIWAIKCQVGIGSFNKEKENGYDFGKGNA